MNNRKSIITSLIYSIIFVTAVSFVACSDDDSEKEWKNNNANAYDKVALNANPDTTWIELKDSPEGINDGVYYCVLKQGAGTEKPIGTSQVKVLYKGFYYNGNIFDSGTNNIKSVDLTELPEAGDPDFNFDSSAVYLLWEGAKYTSYVWLDGEQKFEETNYDLGYTFYPYGIVRGLSYAIQNMVVGDKWLVCIPYTLGYGASGLYSGGVTLVPGYSTLFFEVQLLDFTK
ncbi:FKBP-type peptidyl-prolyl cis-trans isomerase [Dysgonomonadaceae bacterium PH5-43]|nr:FKBP-type peptidyl-prolyl cis-trans isomerase [Dysgonomonadaceae bacterium PH5-43]